MYIIYSGEGEDTLYWGGSIWTPDVNQATAYNYHRAFALAKSLGARFCKQP
jgi:hypothetical protein